VGLTLYIRLTGLPLSIERVELKIEVMLGRFPGVDRTTQRLFGRPFHRYGPDLLLRIPLARTEERLRLGDSPFGAALSGGVGTDAGSLRTRNPKNFGPFQFVPVISRAMVERLVNVFSRQTKPSGTTVTVWRSP